MVGGVYMCLSVCLCVSVCVSVFVGLCLCGLRTLSINVVADN